MLPLEGPSVRASLCCLRGVSLVRLLIELCGLCVCVSGFCVAKQPVSLLT